MGKRIQVWMANDGTLHETQALMEYHEKKLNDVNYSDLKIEQSMSVVEFKITVEGK